MLDFLNDDIFNTDWDLLVIPMSTAGSISQSFQTGLDKLHHSPMVTERNFKLGDVVIEVLSRKNQKKYVAFACSVDKNRSSYSAIRIIGKNLAHKIQELIDIREIATPILGTGAGKLDPFLSRNIMMNAFYEVAPKSVRLTFCTPDLDIYNSFEGRSLDINTPSGQLVIEAEIPNISQNDLIRDLQSTKEFYYELAEQKFQ